MFSEWRREQEKLESWRTAVGYFLQAELVQSTDEQKAEACSVLTIA